jgi:hypothetical protein
MTVFVSILLQEFDARREQMKLKKLFDEDMQSVRDDEEESKAGANANANANASASASAGTRRRASTSAGGGTTPRDKFLSVVTRARAASTSGNKNKLAALSSEDQAKDPEIVKLEHKSRLIFRKLRIEVRYVATPKAPAVNHHTAAIWRLFNLRGQCVPIMYTLRALACELLRICVSEYAHSHAQAHAHVHAHAHVLSLTARRAAPRRAAPVPGPIVGASREDRLHHLEQEKCSAEDGSGGRFKFRCGQGVACGQCRHYQPTPAPQAVLLEGPPRQGDRHRSQVC